MWGALKSRDIDLVISDHSPCTVDLKLLDEGDFMAAWGGISGVQYGEWKEKNSKHLAPQTTRKFVVKFSCKVKSAIEPSGLSGGRLTSGSVT